LEAFGRAVAEQPEHFWFHMQYAGELVSQARPEEALRHYSRAAEIRPSLLENAWYHLQVGNANRDAGHRDQAVAAYQRVLELDSANEQARRWLDQLR
jgi:tetratricopeptide (TPR) repeat protein